jgi:hypothetical protein
MYNPEMGFPIAKKKKKIEHHKGETDAFILVPFFMDKSAFYIASQPHPVLLLKAGMSVSPFPS